MKYRDGYIALLSVLIIAAVMVIFLVGGLFRSTGVANMRIQEEASERARATASACTEHALLALLQSTSYTGDEGLSVGGETCHILALGGTGNTNRSIYTTSTVLGVTWRIQVNVDTVQPDLSISSWQDVLAFSTSTGGGPPPPAGYDWTNPAVSSTVNLPGTGNALSAFAVGTTGYIGRELSTDPEFYIIDASDASNPVTVGSLDLPGDVNSLVVSGNYAYAVTDDDNELLVIDITTPASPVLTTSLNLSGTGDGRDIAVKGNRLYVTRNNSSSNPTLHIFDITTPASPTELGSAYLGAGLYDVALYETGTAYAFIASESNSQEFMTVNVTTPASLSVNGSLNFGGKSNAYAVSVSGTIAYVGTANRGGTDEFYVVDISTPASPSVITSTDYTQVNVLRAANGFVFAGLDDAGNEFVVLDMSTPSVITQAASLNLVAPVDGLGVSSNRAFAVTGNNSQEVIVIVPGTL